MKLQTINTIELSNVCQLACLYCVNRLLVRHPARKPGIMDDETFARSLKWLELVCRRGTQQEVNLNGTGESCLDPQLISRIRQVKDIVGPDRMVQISTNGINMTYELAVQMKDAGLDMCFLSPHSPYHARKAVLAIAGARLQGGMNWGCIGPSHNFAGQLEPEHTLPIPFHIPCHPLMEGRGYISKEGAVSPCCYDYQLIGAYGDVAFDDLLERDITPYRLCRTCHQKIPESVAVVIQPNAVEAPKEAAA